ncbi:chemotaxis protein CheB [Caballeronia sp. LZ024]|uniref:chemotaxis protein CheB n=1 Tax=Caballeronia sp. LZ024 TaxID=3038561 RepID=UPI00285492B4|nr:chemotaxis protein CheB [Caballeronia sp. LZ024]MDR5755207.1 chemotaxis protein CheB [Caballeronia sp. LZ024]
MLSPIGLHSDALFEAPRLSDEPALLWRRPKSRTFVRRDSPGFEVGLFCLCAFTSQIRQRVRNTSRVPPSTRFFALAVEFGERVIGIVLTGDLDEGAAGIAAIEACGGWVAVQTRRTASRPRCRRGAARHDGGRHRPSRPVG